VKIYFISGLGADKRVFSRLQLPSHCEPVYLDWITPLPKESLSSYAKRFASSINPNEDFSLVGLSFGGMLATEIAKFLSPKKIIIVSSIACSKELPWYFRVAGKIGLHKIIPVSFFKHATIANRWMSAEDKETKQMIFDFVKNTDPNFIRWSLRAILGWRHNERLPGLVHIHGSRDHLLPCRYTKADHIIEKGGHLMLINKPAEVSVILGTHLSFNE
jgi:pimeloyl-ACP methyl ester carboxylesterase